MNSRSKATSNDNSAEKEKEKQKKVATVSTEQKPRQKTGNSELDAKMLQMDIALANNGFDEIPVLGNTSLVDNGLRSSQTSTRSQGATSVAPFSRPNASDLDAEHYNYVQNRNASRMTQAEKDARSGALPTEIPTLKQYATGDAAVDEAMGLTNLPTAYQAEKHNDMVKEARQTTPVVKGTSEADTVDEWLSKDKLTKTDRKQAKEYLEQYDKENQINTNVGQYTQEQLDQEERVNALRDKVNKSETFLTGLAQKVPGYNTLMTKGDDNYYGWTSDDMKSELSKKVEEGKDINLTDDEEAKVSSLESEIESLNARLEDIQAGHGTRIAEQQTIKDIENKKREMYAIMLDSGEEKPVKYGYKDIKQMQKEANPGTYFAGEALGMLAGTALGKAALADTGYVNALNNISTDSKLGKTLIKSLEDAPVDFALDSLMEYNSNLADGMSREEANKKLLANVLMNSGINLGVSAAQVASEGKEVSKGAYDRLVDTLNYGETQANAKRAARAEELSQLGANNLVESAMKNVDDSVAPTSRQLTDDMFTDDQLDILGNYGLSDGISEGDSFDAVLNELNSPLSIIDKIKTGTVTEAELKEAIKDPTVKREIENLIGERLAGNPGEYRQSINDALNFGSNRYSDFTEDELAQIRANGMDDLYRQMGWTPGETVDEIPTLTKEVEPQPVVKAVEEEVPTLTNEDLIDDGTGQIRFVNKPSKKKFDTSDTLQKKLSQRIADLDSALSGEDGTELAKEIEQDLSDGYTDEAVSFLEKILESDSDQAIKDEAMDILGDVAPFADDISDDAKAIYEAVREGEWNDVLGKVAIQRQNFDNMLDSLEYWIEPELADEIESAKTILDNIVSAKDVTTVKNNIQKYVSSMNNIFEGLNGRTVSMTTDDGYTKAAYDNVINTIKSHVGNKPLYVNPQVKAEFPDGVFNLNRFGGNIRFTTNKSKGVALNTFIDDLKDQLNGELSFTGNDIEDMSNLIRFLDNSKNGKTVTQTGVVDSNMLLKMNDQFDDIVSKKLKMLDNPTGNNPVSIGEFATNTMPRSGQLTDVEYASFYDMDNFKRPDVTWKQTFEQAKSEITRDGVEKSLDDLLNKEAFTAVDVDKAMQVHKMLSETARETGDTATWKKASNLLKKLSQEASRDGQSLNALKKWSKNTPEGRFAYTLANIRRSVDGKFVKGYSTAVDNLVTQLDEIIASGKSLDEVKKEVNELLSYNLQFFAEDGADAMHHTIKGKAEVQKLLDSWYNLDTETLQKKVGNIIKKEMGVSTMDSELETQVYNLLVEAEEAASQYGAKSREAKVKLAQVGKIVSQNLPGSLSARTKSIIYDNMLASLKTTLTRNAGSNAVYNLMNDAAHIEDVALDSIVGLASKRRAHTLSGRSITEGAKGFKKGVSDTIGDLFGGINTTRSGEDTLEDVFKAAEETFKRNSDNKLVKGIDSVLYWYDRAVGKAMEMGDRPFYEKTYAATKAELEDLVARYGDEGIRKGFLNNGKTLAADVSTEDLIDVWSRLEALESVMQNKSSLSNAMVGLRNVGKELSEGVAGIDLLSMTTTPFAQVPGNMIDRALQYTPLGFLRNAITSYGEKAATGAVNQRRAVRELRRSLNGTLMAAGAAEAAHKGYISKGYSDDKDEKQAQINAGYQEYALQPFGDDSVQIDLSDIPVLGPMLQGGVYIDEAIGDGNITPETLSRATAGEISSVLGESLFQGINRLTGSDIGYESGGGNTWDNIGNTVKSGVTSLVPSFVRQTAQFLDPYKRDMGDYKSDEYYKNLFLNSLPSERQKLGIKYDNEGIPVLQDGGDTGFIKFLDDYVLPYKISHPKYSELNQEASRLMGETGSAQSFVPTAQKSDLTSIKGYNADNYQRSDFTEYKKERGELNSELGTALIQSDFYKGLSDEEKQNVLDEVYKAMNGIAKENAVSRQNPNGTDNFETDSKLAAAYKEGNIEGAIKYLENKYKAESLGLSTNTKGYNMMMEGNEAGATQYANIYNAAHKYGYDMSESISAAYDTLGNNLDSYLQATSSYGAKVNSKTVDVFDALGSNGIKLYQSMPKNDDGNVTLEIATQTMYGSNTDTVTMGKMLFALMQKIPNKLSSQCLDANGYFNGNYEAICNYYIGKYVK